MFGIALLRFVDAIALAMLATAVVMLMSRKMYQNVKILTVQALLLALLASIMGIANNHKELLIAAILTMLVKAFLIPRYLTNVLVRTERLRETSLFISLRITLLIASLLVIVAYHFSGPLVLTAKVTARNVVPVALSLIMLGMLMMIARKKVFSHVLGLIEMENGIYLSALAISGGMPLVVEFGVFFDVLIAIIIMAAFSEKIGMAFSSLDSDHLRNLKG